MAIIILGDDPSSQAYVRQKVIKGQEIGAKITVHPLTKKTKEEELLKLLENLNNDPLVHGVIVQRPLPERFNIAKVNEKVLPKKDIDAFLPNSPYDPPLSKALDAILKTIHNYLKTETQFDDWLKTLRSVVIGKGETGGKPAIHYLQKKQVNTHIIDSHTINPQTITKSADLIITAVGKDSVITKEMITHGAILIGIGMHREKDGKMYGDFREEEIQDVAGFYTPTPGGVGPVNVACLLDNLITAASK